MQDEVLQQAFMNMLFHLEDAHTHVQRLCVSWTTLRHEQQDDTESTEQFGVFYPEPADGHMLVRTASVV